jgi:predicted AAA+ superfamily ATPase
LFGARGTGKTSLLRAELDGPNVRWIDLLNSKEEDRYAKSPELLYDECRRDAQQARGAWVVIDEVQKLPVLLNTVHRIIETREFAPPLFALTGSSARKLRHGGANLLAGRAFLRHLFPLTHRELGERFDLVEALNYGALPKVFGLDDMDSKQDFLESYGLTYLKEEVWAEHLIQDLDPFRKFLEIAAQTNGMLVNFAKIGRDVDVHEKTVKKYFQILEDTLLGFFLEPYHRSVRKRQHQSPKFFLFDLGVKRALERSLRQAVVPQTYAYGRAFEHFLIAEALRLNDYGKKDFKFSYLLTKDGGEIDLLVERPGRPLALVEIKATEKTSDDDTHYLRSIIADMGACEAFCLSRDPHERTQNGVHHLPWMKGLVELGL